MKEEFVISSKKGITEVVVNDVVCLGFDITVPFYRRAFIKSVAIRLSKLAYKVSKMFEVLLIKARVDCDREVIAFKVVGYSLVPTSDISVDMADIIVVSGRYFVRKRRYEVNTEHRRRVPLWMLRAGLLDELMGGSDDVPKP